MRRVGKFSFATLLSRILGYARDALVAYLFGGEFLTDAFYTAFRTSNLLRRLLGEGALSSSFVPVFSVSLKKEPKEEVQEFFDSIFTSLVVILFGLTVAGMIFAPEITHLIAPGFKAHPEKFELTVRLTRWMFPFFFFICLAALLTGVLNSLKHFFIPALAPAMLSVAEISYLLLATRHFSPEQQIVGLAVSVVVGGAAHFAVLLPQLFREGFRLKWHWRWNHPHSVQVIQLMIPAMIGLSVDQVNAFVDTICATFLVKGSVTALYNSNRLMQLPLALFGISIASVSLASMSDHTAEKNYDEMERTLYSSLRIVLFSVMPATVGLLLLGRPIIALLFEHGQFSAFATHLTTRALQGYSLGLIAYSVVKVLANAFYSLRKPNVPVRVAIVCMILNVILNVLLMGPLGVGGLALATAISSWVNAGWLFFLLRKELTQHLTDTVKWLEEKQTLTVAFKTLLSCLAMSAALLAFTRFFSASSPALQVILGVPLGIAVFAAVSLLLKIEEQKLILNILKLKGGRKE